MGPSIDSGLNSSIVMVVSDSVDYGFSGWCRSIVLSMIVTTISACRIGTDTLVSRSQLKVVMRVVSVRIRWCG